MKRIIFLLTLVVMIALLANCSGDKSKSAYTGIVEGKIYSLSSPISDEIIYLPFNEGNEVKAGELVALIDTTSIALQLKQAAAMLAEIKLQQQNGDLQLEQARTSYNYFLDKYKKNIELSKSKAIPTQTLADIKLQLTVNKSKLEMAGLNKKILTEKFDATSYQLQLLQEKLKKAHLRTPVQGVIDKIYYNEGETPPPFSTISDIINLNDVWCYLYVSEVDLANIQIGKQVTVRVDGLKEPLSGTINYINQQAEFTPKTILTPDNRKALVFGVKVSIENKNHVLKPGMAVEVEL
ncbi:MAG: HlyD family efflux transporter periplasmic adaptor subunit [Calditrichaeota bacterium]|nr:HlyD family efflux transporter periplasmic adaptor subunit [Calditrichota bacterium]